jgi:hypothetical protein
VQALLIESIDVLPAIPMVLHETGGGQSLLLTRRDLVDRRPRTLRDGCLCRRREKSEGYEYGWGEWLLVIVVINE